MAKPIFLIRVAADIETERSKSIATTTESKLNNEYHILVAACLSPGSSVAFECFNAENATDIDIEEIKKLINHA